jgi:hypothetical protein
MRSRANVPYDRRLDREVERMVAEARRMELDSAPRKHHLLPASYLKRWEVDGRLRVVDVNSRSNYVTASSKAARDTDFYRIEADGLDPVEFPPLLFEKMLSIVEGGAIPSFEIAITDGIEAMSNLAAFVAFQIARGRQFRARLMSLASSTYREMHRDVTAEGLRSRLNNATDDELSQTMQFVEGIQSGDILVQPQQAQAVWMVGEAATRFMPYLMGFSWYVVRTAAELITTDEPVLMLGGPGWPRGQIPGIATARVIVMPLDPCHLLVLVSPGMLSSRGTFDAALDIGETEQINLELLAHASRWQFSSPTRGATMPCLPPPVPASILERGIEVGNDPGAELMRTFSPNRWLYAGDVPWPVRRWWQSVADVIADPFPSARNNGRALFIRDDAAA